EVRVALAEQGAADPRRQLRGPPRRDGRTERRHDGPEGQVLRHPPRGEDARVGPGGDTIVGDALRERLAGERDGETRRDQHPVAAGALRDSEHEPGNEQREERGYGRDEASEVYARGADGEVVEDEEGGGEDEEGTGRRPPGEDHREGHRERDEEPAAVPE